MEDMRSMGIPEDEVELMKRQVLTNIDLQGFPPNMRAQRRLWRSIFVFEKNLRQIRLNILLYVFLRKKLANTNTKTITNANTNTNTNTNTNINTNKANREFLCLVLSI